MLQLMLSPIGFLCVSLMHVGSYIITLVSSKNGVNKFVFYVSVIVTAVFLGVANRWGYDSINYYIPFYDGSTERKFEPGFSLFVYVVNLLHLPSSIFPVVTVTLAVVVFFISVNRITRSLQISGLILFCLFTMISYVFLYMAVMRQALSTSLIILSLANYLDARNRRAFIYIIIAGSLHFASLVFLLIPLWRKLTIRYQVGILIFSLIFAISSQYLITLLAHMVEPGTVIGDKIIRAINYSDRNDEHKIYILKFLISLFFVISSLVLSAKKNYLDGKISKCHIDYILFTFILSSFLFYSKEASIRYLFVANVFLVIYMMSIFPSVIKRSQTIFFSFILIGFFLVYGFFSHQWLSGIASRFI